MSAEQKPPARTKTRRPHDADELGPAPSTLAHSERYSDVGNAKRLVRLFGDSIRWVPQVGWFWFDGTRWRRDDDGEMVRRAKQVPEAIVSALGDLPREGGHRENAFKFALKSEQAPRVTATLDLAKSEPGITVPLRLFDADPWVLGVDCGAIDMRNGRQFLPTSTAYITRRAGAPYRPHAGCPVWLGFLDRIMGSDIDLVGFLQRAIGYTLTGATSEQCVFILHGPGANGKSVFLRTVRELAGEYGVDAAIDTFLDRRNRESSNDLARLAGARFVCATELDEGKRLAEGLVKTLTGGEAIPARFMYQEYFEFTPIFKVWLAVNHKPTITGDDHGIWRRIRLVPFRVTIPPEEQDRELLDKIRHELPGILNWAIAGAVAWHEVGLSPPSAVVAATDAYRAESDAIGEWLLERCVMAADASIQAKLLYDDYARFIEARGGKPFSMRRWAQRMADRGFEKDEGRLVHYRGLRFCDLATIAAQNTRTFPYTAHTREVPESDLQRSQGRNDDPDDLNYRTASRGE